MKKFIALLLVVALTATVSIGGTLAYLTVDAGDEHNVFTVGNIDVSLDEEVGVIGEGGVVKETTDAESNKTGAEYIEVMPGDFLQKEVTVTNKGKTPVYAAITVLLKNNAGDFAVRLNDAIDNVYGDGEEGGQAMFDEVFAGWGINQDPRPGAYGIDDARGVIDGTYGLPEHVMHVDFAKTTSGSTLIGANNWFIAGSEKSGQYWVDGPKAYDGYYTGNMEDNQICYTYYAYLPAGESTTLFEGLNVPAEFDKDQLAMFDGLTIDITASAIQADNIPVADKYVGDANGEAKTAFELLAEQMEVADGVAIDATVSTVEELDAALKEGAKVIWLNDGEYDIPNSAKGKTLTIMGDSGAVLKVMDEGEGGCDYGFDGSTVTFNGVTIDTSSNTGWEMGYARLKLATYNNCTINGQYSLYGTSVFNNCTLNVSGDAYNIRTWGADKATFVDCTFNSDGKAMLLYGTANTHLAIENCVFNDTGKLADLKAAIEIGDDYGKSYNLVVTNTTVNGYEINDKGISTGTTLWANKNSMDKDHLNVVVDGVDVY